MNTETRKLTLLVLLAVVSILAVQPALVRATPQSVQIMARGSATSGSVSSSARIYLIGVANLNGGGDIQLTHMTGIFQIGPVFYTIVGGQGQTNYQTGAAQLHFQVGGSNPGTLVLQGQVIISGAGYDVLFTPQQSNLNGQYSLWLYGYLRVTQAPYS